MTVIIAAIGKNNELGANNHLLWSLPGDMKYFRETTRGCTVIMGRLTFESIGRALPKRRNIVITSNPAFYAEGVETARSLDGALKMSENDGTVFIIGGARVYKEALGVADAVYLTEIDADFPEADVFFPEFDKTLWNREIAGKGDDGGISYTFVRYTKK